MTVGMSDFQRIALEIGLLLEKKNHDYGDSFSKLYREFGDLSVIIRFSDKVERLKSLIKNKQMVESESFDDTLIDIAGYAILALKERNCNAEKYEFQKRKHHTKNDY